jgi:hypothetical protein
MYLYAWFAYPILSKELAGGYKPTVRNNFSDLESLLTDLPIETTAYWYTAGV